ncbi:class I SAM-dependent methyltransferase [Saccharopolyspora rosea]|uniref:S-adenosyl-L-methionine-dependent methyltransferase n=1 Tax=Saccharopolyspora rosea TaxID=524884 RepID=A0ABW3G3V7_9PSEU
MTGRSGLAQWDIVSGVGFTALLVAAGRAVQTSDPAGLVNDPFAALFVDRARTSPPLPTRPGEPWPTAADDEAVAARTDAFWALMSRFQGVRSRFFDAALTGAAERGAGQVVLLAAGLDARAFRLDWPEGAVIYEIDQPRVLEFKDEVLAEHGAEPRCTRRTVPVDLRDDWAGALRAAGFDPARPTAWLAEGLLTFLPAAAEEELLTTVEGLSAPGSALAVEYFARAYSAMVEGAVLPEFAKPFGVDMSALTDPDHRADPAQRLASTGWRVTSRAAEEVARSYGRPLPTAALGLPFDTALITAELPH